MAIIKSQAHRKYVRRLSTAMVAYIATLVLAEIMIGKHGLTGPLAWILATLPGLSVAAVFWAIGRHLVEENDEYQRMLLVRQTLIATGFALSVATIWGFLENFELVEHVDAYYIAILWFGGLGLGACVNRMTLGDNGSDNDGVYEAGDRHEAGDGGRVK